jgi:hypothetical protein
MFKKYKTRKYKNSKKYKTRKHRQSRKYGGVNRSPYISPDYNIYHDAIFNPFFQRLSRQNPQLRSRQRDAVHYVLHPNNRPINNRPALIRDAGY